MQSVQNDGQDVLKAKVKAWLKEQKKDYAWLAERCYVTETTVRNWMARKVIPAAKEHIIRELIKEVPEVPVQMPERVAVTDETLITVRLDVETRKRLEHAAFRRGMTLAEFLATELPQLGNDEPL